MFNQSDVVIFSVQNLDVSDLPRYRLSHQRFVFYEMESPSNTDRVIHDVSKIRYSYFNWTMTYRMDSDIVNRDSYGMTTPIHPIRPNYPDIGRKWKNESKPLMVNVKQKTKMIAWFVSNCKSQSKREDYIHQLRRFIDVDVYGKCSNKSCVDVLECQAMLKRDYKFYIAFENSLCPDYVTEKLTRTLMKDLIPIVYGAVDYSLFAPPHSYINVDDFQSVEHLARYISLLNENDQLYAQYFEWKRDYSVATVYKKGWCHLCQLAHDDQLPPKIYHDIYAWWFNERPCVQPTFSFK